MPTAKAPEAVAGESPWIALARVQSLRWCLVASALPLAACAAVALTDIDRSRPFTPSPTWIRRVMSNTLLLEAMIAVVAAPLAGVGIAWCRLRPSDAGGTKASRVWVRLATLASAVALFVSVSALLAACAFAPAPGSWSAIAAAHATLGAAALALGGVGALAASLFRDELDAALCSVSLALVGACGVLAAGPAAGDLPTPVINAALLASPIVATASAANIDILRSELLYRLSPLAHGAFDYPAWDAACALYLAIAGLCFWWVALRTRPPAPVVTPESPRRAEGGSAV